MSNLVGHAGSYDDLVHQNADLRSKLEVAIRLIEMLQSTATVPPGFLPMQGAWALPGAGWQMPATIHGTKDSSITDGGAKLSGRSSHVGGGAPKLPSMPEEVESDLASDEDDESSMTTSDGAQGGQKYGEEVASLSSDRGTVHDDAHYGTVPMTAPQQLRPSAKQTRTDDGPPGLDVIDLSGGKLRATPSTTTLGSPGDSHIALTLRRVDGEPLGLEVRPDFEYSCLLVERIQPGTVVEAWNRQCSGEPREIMPGDRVVSVNGATTPEDMRKQFGQKLLLKLKLVRESAAW
jgi:hypothetical protein